MISLKIGEAKCIEGNFKIIHVINLTLYENLANKIISDLPKDAFQDPLFPHIQYSNNNIKKYLTNLRPKKRFRRSIDWLGSAWKWIAGTPDKHDMTIVEEHINNVLKNTNQQVIINQNIGDKINEVIRDFNKINKSLKSTVEDAVFNLQHIEEDLKNIVYAIHWSKQDIINPQLLNQQEMELIFKKTNNNQLSYAMIEETLNFASIKIAADIENVIYIVNLPLTGSSNFEVLTLRNNKRQNPAIELPFNTILYNHEFIYGITQPCKLISRTHLCNNKNLRDITNSTCIPKIIRGQTATCKKLARSSSTVIEELDEGIIFLNNFQGKIKGSCGENNLNGTFIIKYNNCSIEINDQWYSSQETKITAVPQIYQTNWQHNLNQSELSLDELQELHLNNTQIIELIKVHAHANSFSLSLLFVILLIIFIVTKIKKHMITKEEKIKNKEDKENIEKNVEVQGDLNS